MSPKAKENAPNETEASGNEKGPLLPTEEPHVRQPFQKRDSYREKLTQDFGSKTLDVILDKRHRVLILARILLAVPGPAFLVFSAFQHLQISTVTAGWGLSAPITRLETGQNFAIAVGLITLPLWILSLLIAQIEKTAQKFAKGSRVCVKRSVGSDELRLEGNGSGILVEAQKFDKDSRVRVNKSGEKTSLGYVKEYDEEKQVYTVESFGNVKEYDAKKQVYKVELEKIGSGQLVEAEERDITKKPAQKFAKGSRVRVKRYVGSDELRLEGIGSGTPVEAQKFDKDSRVRVNKSGEKTSLGYVKEYDEKKQVYTVESFGNVKEYKEKEQEYTVELENCTSERFGEASMRHDPLEISFGRLVRLWNYFLSLWKWDLRIWSWPKAFEAALFWGCLCGYAVLYLAADLIGALIFLAWFGAPVIALILYVTTQIVRSTIDHQDNQKAEYHTFVNLQAVRLGILTVFSICLTVYALSAMSRVIIPYDLVLPFSDLSLSGITCTDRDAFRTAFEASAANASCPVLPACGYESFESLCQAVQYAPMVHAVGVDLLKVLAFNWLAWMLGSLLVFGTGRASASNGYAQLLSKHMLFAIVLALGQLMSACYALMRLLLLVPMLRLPRPAAYFDEKGLITRELPLYCYGTTCSDFDYAGTIFVHVIIALALNFDFLKKYASAIGAGDQAAIDKLKEKMRQKKKNEVTGEMECEWSDAAPYFYFLPRQVVLECKTRSLPPMQILHRDNLLERKQIRLIDAFKQAEKEALLAKEKAAAKKAAAKPAENAEEAALKAAKEAGKITVLEFSMALNNLRNNHDAAEAIREPKEAAVVEVAPEKEAAKQPVEVGLAKEKTAAEKVANGTELVQIKDILFVSHRWEEPGRPDVDGEQLKAIQAYLEVHPEIKWVWFDYSSMPQKIGGIDTRTLKEKAEFQLMLKCITDFYLTAQVLILLDGSYASRFWTLTEAWCSMQTATEDGIHNSISKTEEAVFTGAGVQVGSRCTIKCIHNAAQETTSKGLVDLVATKTPENMYKILEKPDVNVTNQKDKEAMLPVIQKTNKHVIEGFKNNFRSQESEATVPVFEPDSAHFSRALFRCCGALLCPPAPASRSQANSKKSSKTAQVAPSSEDSNAVTAY